MSAIPRPKRNAEPGEIVNYFEGGDPTAVPVSATVHVVHSGGSVTLMFMRPGTPTVITKTGVQHMYSPYWDAVPLSAKQANGAFDFHPVYGPLFDKHLQLAVARKARQEQLESEKNELSTDEFSALTALERHGDNMSKIIEETGFTPAKLKKMEKFTEALNAVKDANFAAKNPTE